MPSKYIKKNGDVVEYSYYKKQDKACKGLKTKIKKCIKDLTDDEVLKVFEFIQNIKK